MAEMTEADFLRATDPNNRITSEQVGAAAAAGPPSSAAAAYAQRRNAQDLAQSDPGILSEKESLGEERGIPFDIESGMGAGTQFQVSRRRTPEDKLRYLAEQFGADKVRLNKKGDPIVRVKGEDGKEKDVLVNSKGLSWSDFGAVIAHIPELAGAMVGPAAFEALAAKMTGAAAAKLGLLGRAFASSAGAEIAGGAQDLIVRSQDNAPLQPAEIFMERGISALANTATQAALGAGLEGVNVLENLERTGKISSPLKFIRGPIQDDAVAAAGRIQQRTGLPMEISVGASTGHPLLAATEGYLETNPIGAGPQLVGKARREAQRVQLQNWMVRPDTLPLDEEIGRRGIGVLTDIAESADEAVMAAKRRVEAEGQQGIKDLLNQRFNRDVAPNPAVIAKTLRKSGIDAKEAWDTEVGQRYEALWNHPNSNVPNVPAAPISKAADSILSDWPKDPNTGEILTRNAPEGLLSKVQEAASLGIGKMPLKELAGLRTFFDQNITGGQAITGIKEGKLIALRGAINDTIKAAVEKDPALKALYHRANDYYAENVGRFNNKLIDQLFKTPEHAGYIGDAEFLKSLSASSDKYKRIQAFFGRSSDEMRLINREVADDLLRKSLRSGFGDEIDSQALRKNMAQLHDSKATRDVFFGVFGKRGEDILKELNAMDRVGTLKGNMSAREFADSLDPATASRPSVIDLLQSQLDTETIYANNVVKRFVKGELPATAIRGEDFVNTWVDNADLRDVRQVMGLIRNSEPQLAEEIGRKQLQKFFRESSRQPTPADVMHELRDQNSALPSALGMFKQLGNKDAQAKMEAVIGPDAFDLLKDYVRVELADEEKKRLASGVGIFTKGSVVSMLIKHGFSPAEVTAFAKIKGLSYLMSSPKITSWLASGYKAEDMPDLFKMIITSQPFISAVSDDLKGDSRAFEMISALKHAGFGGKRQATPQRSQIPTMTEQEFMDRTQSK